jgi:hypothetical protein
MLRRSQDAAASFSSVCRADQRAVWPALVGCQSFVAVHKRPKIVLFLWDPGSMKLDARLLHGNYGGQLR